MQNPSVLTAVKATQDSECLLILVLTETEHTVLLIDKYWLQAAILVMSFSETTVRHLQRERSDETLVLASFRGDGFVDAEVPRSQRSLRLRCALE